jgi:hypothetical protein
MEALELLSPLCIELICLVDGIAALQTATATATATALLKTILFLTTIALLE